SVALALLHKTPVPEYDRLTLVVDKATLGLRMLIAHDAQGGTSTFNFTHLRENGGPPASRSRFRAEPMLSPRTERAVAGSRRYRALAAGLALALAVLPACATTNY